ncbi:MAG: hypothetical protein WCK67_09720 [bacterium]
MNIVGLLNTHNTYTTIKPKEKNEKVYQLNNNEKANSSSEISIKEATVIFMQGAATQIKNTALSIIHHPIKVVSSIALTSAAIAVLPIFGISMAVGTSTLSVGFLVLSSIKLTKGIAQGIHDYQNKDYNNLRKDIKNTGADSVDFALAAPFANGSIKMINRQLKYGKITFNKSLWDKIKAEKSINKKIIALIEEQYTLTFNQILKERSIKLQPRLEFVHLNKNMQAVGGWNNSAATISIYENNIPFNLKNFGDIKERTNIIYLPYIKACLKKIKINNLSPIKDIAKTCKDFMSMASRKLNISSIDNTIAHELTHMEQYIKIARTEGLGIEAIKPMNTKFYKAAVKSLGTIKKNTKEAEQALKYLEARKSYVSVNPKDFEKYLDSYPKYRANLLEQEAFKVGDDYTRLRANIPLNYIQEMNLVSTNDR